jgi:DNA-binding transcriptional LysR family regulator
MGTVVIERLPRGVRPTAAGVAAGEQARVALPAAGQAVEAARKAAAGQGGRIRVACAETMTGWLLAPVLRSWGQRFPDVEIDLQEYTSADRMLEVLLAGDADTTVAPPPTKTDEHVEVLGTEEIVVVAARGHRFAGMDAVPLRELRHETLVHYHASNGNAVWVDELAARCGVRLPLPALRTGSPRSAVQLAAAGTGAAIVPVSALATQPDVTVRSVARRRLRRQRSRPRPLATRPATWHSLRHAGRRRRPRS